MVSLAAPFSNVFSFMRSPFSIVVCCIVFCWLQNKFFKADGYKFAPFSFKEMNLLDASGGPVGAAAAAGGS